MSNNILYCKCGSNGAQVEKSKYGFRMICPVCHFETDWHIEYADAERAWVLKVEKYMAENNYTCPTRNLERLKNIHRGSRCFIIGSGPSLRVMDLKQLYKDITFGGNQVYRFYEDGLPELTYWFVGDHTCIPKIRRDRADGYDTEKVGQRFYRAGGFWVRVAYYPNANPYYVEDVQPIKEFKCDLTKPITHGNSITSESIAFAIYMGCDPIYIIGVDMNYKPEEPGYTSFSYQKAHQAHEKIREYCDKNNIRIFNAGVDGKLNAYKRVDYNLLF